MAPDRKRLLFAGCCCSQNPHCYHQHRVPHRTAVEICGKLIYYEILFMGEDKYFFFIETEQLQITFIMSEN